MNNEWISKNLMKLWTLKMDHEQLSLSKDLRTIEKRNSSYESDLSWPTHNFTWKFFKWLMAKILCTLSCALIPVYYLNFTINSCHKHYVNVLNYSKGMSFLRRIPETYLPNAYSANNKMRCKQSSALKCAYKLQYF